ncbi:b(0,+)-type amino acid transporter 1-like isoform X1 [Pezoporus occidentalis]|uniref:b(0,+)-type amino acid transporter 1-like isoform X1 n=1 Tax=Pezoporus occidentalis TaxID=407982 RepID=UPI002F91B91C
MRKTTDSPHSSTDVSEGKEKLRLKQEVGLISGVSLIAGTMIGSGIFMSPEWVLDHMRSPASSLLIWGACGLLGMFGALSYTELGTIIKESGGEYIYILRIFGSFPAFLVAYNSVILVRPAGLAAACLSFAEYAVAPFYPGCSSPPVVIKCTAAACILLLTIINCLNMRLATSVMNIFTAAKLLALLVIVVGGLVLLTRGQTQRFHSAFQNTTTGIRAVGVAFYQGLWSYNGWNNLNYVIEELKKPEVTLPRAVMIAIPLVTCLYLLVNMSYLAAMTPSELLSSGAVAATWDLIAWFFYGMTISGLLYLKIKKPELPRSYKVPIIIPIIVLMPAVYLVLAPVIDQPQFEILYIILFTFSGVILYFSLVRFKCHPRFLQRVTLHLQLFLEVAPTTWDAN